MGFAPAGDARAAAEVVAAELPVLEELQAKCRSLRRLLQWVNLESG